MFSDGYEVYCQHVSQGGSGLGMSATAEVICGCKQFIADTLQANETSPAETVALSNESSSGTD